MSGETRSGTKYSVSDSNTEARRTDGSEYGDMIDDGQPDVFRATDEFPAGPECDLEPEDVPDDEDEFETTQHYDDRRNNRQNPNITETVVDYLLNNGEVREAPGDWENPRYLFQARLSGYWSLDPEDREETTSSECKDYEWTLIVADDGEDADTRFALITIYSNYHGSVGTTNKYFDRLKERRGDR